LWRVAHCPFKDSTPHKAAQILTIAPVDNMDSMWGEQLHLGGLPWKHPKVLIPPH
jgi:hypothetical protein